MAETKKPSNKERLQEITAGIEQGIKELFESDRFMSYLRTMSRFHTYSVNNQMLIHMQMPGATRVAGFNKWKNQFERHVKKGEKGLKIIAPTPFKKKIEEMKLDPDTRLPVLDREGRTVMEEKEVEIPMFRPVTVFDVSQTEGKPLPQLAAELHGNVQHYEVFIEALRRTSPVPMGFEKMQGMDGYFSEEQQRVAICEGMSEVQTVCAAVHEITHAKLHNYEKARLEAARGDETKEPPKPKDRRTEEVEAESVSYAVCQYYGIETGENSFGYIASWSNGKELPELRASLETIGRTASSLITDIDRHFRDICKERGIDLTAPEQATAPVLTAASLAVEIDEFSYHFDPYHYQDSVEDREQAVNTLTADIEQNNVQYLRDYLQSVLEDQDGPYAQEVKNILDKLNTLAPVPEADTPERFAADLYDYMDSLHRAGMADHPFPSEPREQALSDIVYDLRRGDFQDYHYLLSNAGLPSASDLQERLDRLSEARDAALVFQMEANPLTTGIGDRHFIQAYERSGENAQLIPREVIYVGSPEECQGLLARLESRAITVDDVRAYEREKAGLPPRRYGIGADGQPERLFNGKTPEEFTEQDALLFLADTDMRLFGQVTAGTLETMEKAGFLYENGMLAPLPDNEAVFLVDNLMYLYIQTCDTGYDYTLYEKQGLREYDGGRLERPDLSIDEARVEIVALHELTLEHAERVPTAIMDVIDPPPVMPGTEPPQGPPYDVSAYTDRQWEEIKEGWASKVDTSLYSNPALNAMQMHVIREGLEKGWPAKLYAKPELSWEQMELVGTLMDQGYDVTAVMVGGSPVDFTDPALSLADTKWLLRQMEYDAIPKMLYTPEQWAEIRQGMEGGLDVKQYADPRLPAQDMARLRDALERGLIIQPATEPEAPAEGKAEPMQAKTAAMLPDAPEQTLDEYPMPDQTLTHADLTACGYMDGDMLPLSKDRALELFEQDLTIYTISGTGEASMAFEREDIVDHGGMFAVPEEEWEESRGFYHAIEDRKNHQEEREAAFLGHQEDCFAIYQVKDRDDLRFVRFMSLAQMQEENKEVLKDNYDLVYTSQLYGTSSTNEKLELIWEQFNQDHPIDYHSPSLSVSDIVALKQNGVVTCHYCDSFGFTELSGFLPPDNPLKNAEMALEDDYGMIDGIINNGPKQPTVAELEAQVKAGEQISLLDLANAVQRERGDKKKSVVERLKQQPPQRDRKKTAPKKSAEREL